MPNESYEEWLSDFAAGHITTEDLERLLIRARQTQDEELRRVVKAHMFLRRLVREGVLPMIGNAAQAPEAVQPSFVETLRRLVSDSQPASAP